jgi:choline kinase
MRILIITIAGTARRFNQELKEEVVKSIFYEVNYKYSLLYQLCIKAHACDKIIIVGGYKIEQVSEYITTYMSFFSEKIELVFNPYFESYGTAYSLFLGITAAQEYNPDEIIFSEGDLYFSNSSFEEVVSAKSDVLTINVIPIEANKAVVLYKNFNNHIKYIYDTKHTALTIREPFLAVYNSAQVWKFINIKRLSLIVKELSHEQITGTNLEIINGYFSSMPAKDISLITMDNWINCNTIHDYDNVIEKIEQIKGDKNEITR